MNQEHAPQPITRREKRALQFNRPRHLQNQTYEGGIVFDLKVDSVRFSIEGAYTDDFNILKAYSATTLEIEKIKRAKENFRRAGRELIFTPDPRFPIDFYD